MKAAKARNIEELRVLARRRLPRIVRDYVEGGAEDHLTLRANREALQSIRFAPRVLAEVSHRSLKTSLFGRDYDAPTQQVILGVLIVLFVATYARESHVRTRI